MCISEKTLQTVESPKVAQVSEWFENYDVDCAVWVERGLRNTECF